MDKAVGIRQDNLNAKRPDGRQGFRFFQEDEDEYGLEGILQAMCWREVCLTPLWAITTLSDHGGRAEWKSKPGFNQTPIAMRSNMTFSGTYEQRPSKGCSSQMITPMIKSIE